MVIKNYLSKTFFTVEALDRGNDVKSNLRARDNGPGIALFLVYEQSRPRNFPIFREPFSHGGLSVPARIGPITGFAAEGQLH